VVPDVQQINGDNEEQVTTKKEEQAHHGPPEPGHCVKCRKAFMVDGKCSHFWLFSGVTNSFTDKDILIGFACGHIYHLSCIMKTLPDDELARAQILQKQLVGSSQDEEFTRSVGPKIAHAQIIKGIASRGCPHCGLIVE
jgi:hypothetical protein